MFSLNEAADGAPVPGFNAAAQGRRVAEAAARRAGVTVGTVDGMAAMREVSVLLESVWGRTEEGVPLSSELMRSLVHAGGAVTAARDGSGRLVGAAVLSVAAPPGATYSLIAAAAEGSQDRGVGYALKLDQRWWALERGYRTMTWTFDPLVSRNARFNLVKLGAVADDYQPSFYGRMSDRINGDDDSDRLVARWLLDSRRAVAATEGTADQPAPAEEAEVLAEGPDREPMLRRDDRGVWCRVPRDILDVRRRDPGQAAHWRSAVRDAISAAFADGCTATSMTRDGWYLLSSEEDSR